MKKLLATILVLMSIFMLVGYDVKESTYNDIIRLENKLMKEMEVESICSANNTDGEFILEATVITPNYSEYMVENAMQVEETANDTESVGRILYSLMYEKAKHEDERIDIDVSISLTQIDPVKAEWSEEELEKLAKQEALNIEIEEFLMQMLMEYAPEYENVEE